MGVRAVSYTHLDQQRDNRGADGHDEANAKKAERDQQAESRFRAVGGRAKSVETKDGNALRRTDLLGAFVARSNGLADNEVK